MYAIFVIASFILFSLFVALLLTSPWLMALVDEVEFS